MNINTYFGVKSLQSVTDMIKSMDGSAQCALFIGIGLAAYGYFKYGNGNKTLKKVQKKKAN